MNVFTACMHGCHICTVHVDIKFAGTGVTDSCELPCRCWKSNPHHLEKQQVFLTSEVSVASKSGASRHDPLGVS